MPIELIRKFDVDSRRRLKTWLKRHAREKLYVERLVDGHYFAQEDPTGTMHLEREKDSSWCYVGQLAGRTEEWVIRVLNRAIDNVELKAYDLFGLPVGQLEW